MKQSELDTRSSYNRFWAKKDINLKNSVEKSNYSSAQRTLAERIRQGLMLCYSNSGVFINYRKKFIAVKVNHGRVRDRFILSMLEHEYQQNGITKAVTGQGVIYRIPKDVG